MRSVFCSQTTNLQIFYLYQRVNVDHKKRDPFQNNKTKLFFS